MVSRRHVLAGLAGVGGVGLGYAANNDSAETFTPGGNPNAEWPLPRYDTSNSAYSPDAVAPRESVQVRWTADMGWRGTDEPLVANGTVFFPTVTGLYALDSQTGEERWRYEPPENPWIENPMYFDGIVYLTNSVENQLYAFDATSGDTIWSRDDFGEISSVLHLVAGEDVRTPALYLGGRDGAVFRLDPKTGDTTWQTDLFGPVTALSYYFRMLYVGTNSGEVYTYDAAGDVPREMNRQTAGSKILSITPSSDGVFVTTVGDSAKLFHHRELGSNQRKMVDADWASTPPVLVNSRFYTTGIDGLSTWRSYEDDHSWRIKSRFDSTGPIAAGDRVYAASTNAVHAFKLTGGIGIRSVRLNAERWKFSLDKGYFSGLAVADSALFAARNGTDENETTLYCLEEA
ncbi:outer membrane protein assembly factor BamB family protein [Haladaptatus sp. CMSO5]|uniref:outer membrane protein assembly factor BamB family protein n=1 Tax=Haladaptatus sp. CMSO5 TaxID=3120514 RepID=UPI002FCE34A1